MASAVAFLSGILQLLEGSWTKLAVTALIVVFGAGFVLLAERNRQMAIRVVVVLVAVAVGGAIGYLIGHRGGPDQPDAAASTVTPSLSASPSPSPSSPSQPPPSATGPTVTFDDPTPPPIVARSQLDLSGTIDGLAPGHQLFIVSRTFGNSADYFLVEGDAIPVENGQWTAHDGGVGSATDKPGTKFRFMAVDADPACAKALTAAGHASDAHRVKKDAWPAGCTRLEPHAVVTLR